MKVVAGCDGGGTKCHVKIAICDDTGKPTRTAEAIAGSANVKTNPNLALQNIQRATNEALRNLDLAATQSIDVFVAALAGAGTPIAQSHWQSQLLECLPVRKAMVVPDAEVLFAAAGVEHAAVATVIGTGSIAWARHNDGTITRAGGLGPAVGDEGSAYWIGKQAIQHSVENHGPANALTSLVNDSIPASQLSDISNHDIAQLAAKIFELAENNDEAKKIIQTAATHIVKLLSDSTSEIPTSPAQPLAWICAGGVALGQPQFLEAVRQRATSNMTHLSPPILVRTPVDGALKTAISQQSDR